MMLLRNKKRILIITLLSLYSVFYLGSCSSVEKKNKCSKDLLGVFLDSWKTQTLSLNSNVKSIENFNFSYEQLQKLSSIKNLSRNCNEEIYMIAANSWCYGEHHIVPFRQVVKRNTKATKQKIDILSEKGKQFNNSEFKYPYKPNEFESFFHYKNELYASTDNIIFIAHFENGELIRSNLLLNPPFEFVKTLL